MLVLKFGGTSVSSKHSLEHIRSILLQKNEPYFVVVSALSGVTNLLENMAHQALKNTFSPLLEEFRTLHLQLIAEMVDIPHQTELILEVQHQCNVLDEICHSIYTLQELSPKTQALMLSKGEELSAFILSRYLNLSGCQLQLLDSKALLVADGDYLKGEVDFQRSNANIQAAVKVGNYIAGGFMAANENGEVVTLGRGGSDYSAAIYAGALQANALEIWSDIDGIHSADPSKVKNTKFIEKLSYEEAFELAYFGAKVVYPPSVIPVMKNRIPLYIKNTFHPEQKGTLVSAETIVQDDKIQGISSLSNIAMLTVSGIGLAKQKGKARKIFQTLEESDVNVILITQSSSEQSVGIAIDQDDLALAEQALNAVFAQDMESGLMNPLKVVKDQCIIAVVGDNMKNKVGLSGKVFSALGENGINILAIAQGASERNISIVIDQKEEVKALNVLHEKFFSNAVKNVHLFIAGIGNVGKAFLNVIEMQREHLLNDYHIHLKIVGVANSSRFMINEADGLSLSDITNIQEKGIAYTAFPDFLATVKALNLRNALFIDNTASQEVSNHYAALLQQSISVVTCNKIACSSAYSQYALLQQLAKEHNCHFKYETAVGAALPIIKTIHDLLISGDRIDQIEAVISGSLNFIFNAYDGQRTFSEVVLQAKEEGYTEPDPLIDLSGLDVMRKILILSREAGYANELADIEFENFLPEDCSNAKSSDELFAQLTKHEAHFHALYQKAHKKGNKLKVLATMQGGKMKVALREIQSDSPFYNLDGKDNVVAINTNRYNPEPLVIKGAGAGASITASGVFADLMFITNR
tara:strand:- start:6707 stop:9139 length:2433 start_codon:yes stop_codon:yes gene_type:complete